MGSPRVLILLTLAASAVAGPLTSSGPCARQCTKSSKFLYNPGTSYFYDYETDIITTMQGTTREESRLHLKTKVEIHAVSKCDFIMRLSGVSLDHSEPLNPRSRRPVAGLDKFRQSLERYTLRFSFQDGRIETICPADEEAVQTLNIKRGILSALQTSTESLDTHETLIETDVSGKCIVNYEPLGRGWNSVTLRKSKDLTICSERNKAETAIQLNPFVEGKGTKSMSLVQGNQDCQQVFKHNRLESVTCSETHLFRPFSRQDGGAMTKVIQVLKYNNEKKVAFTGAEFSSYRKAMTYDHEPNQEERDRRTREVEGVLGDLCLAAKDDITAKVPEKFTSLVYGLRRLEYTDLNNMYRRTEQICPGNSKAKKMLLDGVAMAGTSGALKFIVEVIQKGEMSEKEIDLWISTLAFVNKPSKDSLVALMPLLDGKRLNAILPVSAVVHTYCLQNAECEQASEVRQIVQKFVQLLGNSCNEDKEQVMLALKALGNIGVAGESKEKLQTCAQSTSLDTEVRVASIQAYRRFSCDVSRSPISELYAKQDEDVEVRIASFLSIMRCPSQETLATVKNVMEAEKMKQVGSFVMSYLKNIQDEIPFRSEVLTIVNNLDYLNKFESDIRKYSSNYQTSFNLSPINSTIDLESNVIFGKESYIPRTTSLNLTVDMMGASVNLFQMETRVEGLEKIIEKMFGPEGYFRRGSSQSASRVKKSISDNRIEKLSQKYDVRSTFEKDASLSLDMKIFGNSLWYKKFKEGKVASEAFGAMDIMVELAKEQDIELTKSFLFLDTTFHVPTCSGMPMKLAINGSAVLNLKMNGKLDMRSLQNVDVRGRVEPSCAVTIDTKMFVDAGVAQTALTMKVTAHSSTVLDGLVEIRDKKLWHATLNMPRDQQEIFDIQSRIFLSNGQEEHEQKPEAEKNTPFTACSGTFTSKPLGVEMCGEMKLPLGGSKSGPQYPLSGPAQFRVYLRKTDPKLTKYDIEMKWTEDKNGRDVVGQHLMMTFNTPESQIDREVSAEFHLNKQDSIVSMRLKVPNKKIALIGKRVLKDDEKRLSMAVSVDDKEMFSMSASMLAEAIEGGTRYQPALEIRGPSSRLLNIRSSASIKPSKLSGEVVIEDLTAKPLILNGEMTVAERNRYEITAMAESYAVSAKVKGHVQLRNGFSCKLNTQYRIMDGPKETLEVTSKIRDLSASGLIKYSGAASLVSSALPEFTSSVGWETQITSGHIENSFDLSFGDGRIRKIHKISISEIVKYNGKLDNNNVEGTFRLTYPEKDIDLAIQMNHKNTLESLLNTVNVKLAPDREVSSSVDVKFNTRPMKLSSDIQLKYPGREVRLQGNVSPKQDKGYEATMMAQWQRGKQISAVCTFKDGSSSNGMDYRGTLEMTIPNTRPISISSQLMTKPGQYLVSADADFYKGPYSVKGEYNSNSAWNHQVNAMVKLPKTSYTAVGTLQKTGEKIVGQLDLNAPETRRVTGNVELTNGAKVKTGVADIKWDAERDQSKRIQIDGEFRLTAEGHQGKINLKSPVKTMAGSYQAGYVGQFSSGIMRGNLHAELEWENNQKVAVDVGGNAALKQSRRQLNGEIKVATPMKGFEDLLLTIQHSEANQEWNNKLIVQWKQNSKIIFGTEGKIRSDSSSSLVDASARLNTPFRGFESLSARQMFEKRQSEIVSSSSVQWAPNRALELSLSGALEGSNDLRASANITTPFRILRDFSMSASGSNPKNNLNGELQVRWNTQNSLSLNFDGRSVVTGRKSTGNVELKFQSSIRNYEKMMAKVSFNKDARSANINSNVQWNSNKFAAGINGVNRNSNRGVDLEGKIDYSTTFSNYEKGELKLKHVNDDQKMSSIIESSLPYKHNLNMKFLGNMPSYQEMDSSLDLTSTFIKGLKYQVAYKLDSNRLAANGEAVYGTQKVKGDLLTAVQVKPGVWDLDCVLNLNTPVRGFEEIRFSATQKRNTGNNFTTRLQASKNQETFTLNHDMKIADPLSFDSVLRVTTPYATMRSAEISTKQTAQASELKHVTEAHWGSEKVSLDMELSNQSPRRGHKFEGRLRATTPFPTLSSVNVEVQHEDDERSFKPKFRLQWNEDQKFIIEAMLNNNRFKKVEASLEGKTSFRGYEVIAFNANYDVSAKQKNAEMSYRWSESSKHSVTVKGTLEADSKRGSAELILTTPVRAYESVQIRSDYSLNGNGNTLNFLTKYGNVKYSLSGKHVRTSNGNQLSAELETPIRGFEKLSALGSYTATKNEMSSELSCEWSSNKKILINSEYRLRNGKMSSKIEANSPFHGYKKMSMKIEGDIQSPRKTGSVVIEWEPNRAIQIEGAFESDYSRFGNIDVQWKSPFENFKHLSFNGNVKYIPSEYSAEVTFLWTPSKKVTGKVLLKDREISVRFDTPYRPYRNVELFSKFEKLAKEAFVSASVEWDNANKADFSAKYKIADKMLEGKVELNIPFEGKKTYSASGSLMNDKLKMMEGHIEIIIPNERYETSTLIRQNNGKKEITLSFKGPKTHATMNGNLEVKNVHEIEGDVKMDSTIKYIPSFSAKGSYKNTDWKNIISKFAVDDIHMISGSFKNDDKVYQVDVKLESPSISFKRVALFSKINAKDIQNLEGNLVLETPSQRHVLTASEKYTKGGLEAEIKAESPVIPGKEVAANVFYRNKKYKDVQGKVSVNVNRKQHEIELNYNMENRNVAGSMNIRSELLPTGNLKLAGKLYRPSDSSLETTFTAETESTRHTLTANGQVQSSKMDLTVSVDSPIVSRQPISITANMNNDDFRNIDAKVLFKCSSGDSQGMLKIKRNGWRDLEASFTLDSSAEPLKMLQAELKMRNEGFRSMEGSLDIKSSLQMLREASISGKMRNSDTGSELSFSSKLPVRNFEVIAVSANVQKNSDWSKASPKITLILPNRKYVFYGDYEFSGVDFKTVVGSDWNNKKSELSLEKRQDEFRASAMTPFRGHEHYEAVVNFKTERGKRMAVIMFEDAQKQKYTAELGLNFNNVVDFIGEAKLKMPSTGEVSTKMRQLFRRGRWSTSFEYITEKNKKVTFNFEHGINPVAGSVQIVTPMKQLKTMKMNYSWQNANGKLDMELNERSVLRMEMENAYKSDSRSYSRNIQLDLPSFPYSLTLSSKPLPGGHEVEIKSVLPSRNVAFQTMYQTSSSHFSHGAKLSLDERSGQTISYEIRSSPSSRQASEFYARLNMPVRSMELRTTHEKTSAGRTISGDLFWDIARDQTKHMKLTLEDVDNSNRQNVGHKIRISAAHPQLEKDMVLATEFLKSPSEFYGKIEVEYSRHQQHNVLLETRLKSIAQNRRETRYTATLSAKHPVSNLDLKVATELANTKEEMVVDMQFEYMDRNLHQQIQQLRANIQKVKQNIELMARSNENKMNLLGRISQQDNQLTLSVEPSVNDKAYKPFYWRWNQKMKKMHLDLPYFNDGRLYIKAAMPDDHVETEFGHSVSDRQVKDASFYIGLKDSKILLSRIQWRPEVYGDIQESYSSLYKRYMPVVMRSISSLQNEISDEFSSKSEKMSSALLQETKPFISDMSKEVKKLSIDSQRILNELCQMYKRDEFYLNSATRYAQSGVQAIRRSYEATVAYISKKYEIISETVSMIADISMNIVQATVEDMIRAGKVSGKYIQKNWTVMIKRVSQFKKEHVDRMQEFVKELIHRTFDRVSAFVPDMSGYRKMVIASTKNAIVTIQDWMKGPLKFLSENPGLKALSNYISGVIEAVSEFSSGHLVQRAHKLMGNGVESFRMVYKYVMDHPKINYLSDAVSNAIDQMRHVATELGVDSLIVTVLEELLERTQELSWAAVRDAAEQYTVIQRNAKLSYKPEKGEIEIEVWLPLMTNSLKDLLDISNYPQIQKLKYLSGQWSLDDLYFWDSYYKYKRYLDRDYWIPPFKAEAMLVGSHHYLTFDNFDFDFTGECSYLLARDFVDGNFTVTVNYARENNRIVKKSLNIYSDGVKIEVSRDSKVTIDDHKVELPQEIGKTAITLEDGVITVSRGSDYLVKCNTGHDYCKVEVGGFYFGKTGGLFGTYNYEPADDMTTAEKKVVDSMDEFSESWKVGDTQCTRSKVRPEVLTVNPSAKKRCEKLFSNAHSEFRAAFKLVNPDPFLRMCISDLSSLRESEQKSMICSSAASYIERSRQEGIHLKMPKHCVTCQRLNANRMESGDVVKITKNGPVRAADVVFIVEEKDCNKYAPAVLSKLAQSIEDGFRKSGFRQVNFAVVGFGGSGLFSEPHVVTSDSQVFGTVRNIDSALNSLPTGDGESDIFMALRYAAGLPFLTGSTKTFILSKCSPCQTKEMKADYSEMLRTMLDSDITLHLLMNHEFETKPPNKPEQAKKVLGFDIKHAYTTKDMKISEIRGDRDLLAQLKTPKDLCVPLALEVNGSFFSMARLQEKRSANKKTVEVLSKRIIKTAQPAECQLCECIETPSGIGKSVCQRCVSPVVARLVSDDYSPMMNFESDNDII